MKAMAITAVVAFGLALAVSQRAADREGAVAEAMSSAQTIAPVGATSQQRLARAQDLVRIDPTRADAHTALAGVYLTRWRETGDRVFLARADRSVRRGLELAPGNAGALATRGTLRLAQHDFAGGLRDARAARRAAPEAVVPLGVEVDALTELGRLREASQVLQVMVDRRPNLESYSRVSYQRELRGDLDGAADALRLAADAASGPQDIAFITGLLADIDQLRGRTAAARAGYMRVLALVPDDGGAHEGLAGLDAAAGRLEVAAKRLRGLAQRQPGAGTWIAYGEAELARGNVAIARRQFARAGRELLAGLRAGLRPEGHDAEFFADHGDARVALRIARQAYRAAPSDGNAEIVGLSLRKLGRFDDAVVYARRSLRHGSADPHLVANAGLAEAAVGNKARARVLLRRALRGGLTAAPLRARQAQEVLDTLR